MTNEQINAAIAIECGWTQVEAAHRSGRRPGATYVGREFVPDYCNDLNAMHEAEGHLTTSDRMSMSAMLVSVLGRRTEYAPTWRATARERAEAFLRTLGKWEEVHPC